VLRNVNKQSEQAIRRTDNSTCPLPRTPCYLLVSGDRYTSQRTDNSGAPEFSERSSAPRSTKQSSKRQSKSRAARTGTDEVDEGCGLLVPVAEGERVSTPVVPSHAPPAGAARAAPFAGRGDAGLIPSRLRDERRLHLTHLASTRREIWNRCWAKWCLLGLFC
jgi:hypothetical protein